MIKLKEMLRSTEQIDGIEMKDRVESILSFFVWDKTALTIRKRYDTIESQMSIWKQTEAL